jgi:hypothetical protein
MELFLAGDRWDGPLESCMLPKPRRGAALDGLPPICSPVGHVWVTWARLGHAGVHTVVFVGVAFGARERLARPVRLYLYQDDGSGAMTPLVSRHEMSVT